MNMYTRVYYKKTNLKHQKKQMNNKLLVNDVWLWNARHNQIATPMKYTDDDFYGKISMIY